MRHLLAPLIFLSLQFLYGTLWAQSESSLVLTPLELLQKVLPSDLYTRPKLSLKENLQLLFSELENYAQTTQALPDSDNLSTRWTSQKDRELIEIILTNKEPFLTEGSGAIKSYFKNRMKKFFRERPIELWDNYFIISSLFSDDYFWLNYFESILSQKKVIWSKVSSLEWFLSTVLPLWRDGKVKIQNWNQDFMLNLINLAKYQWSQAVNKPNNSSLIKSFITTLEDIDGVFALYDQQSKTQSNDERNDIERVYFDFLQDLSSNLIDIQIVNFLNSNPASLISNVESLIINILLQSFIDRKIVINIETPRIKNFLSRQAELTQWLNKNPSLTVDDSPKLHRTIGTVFYLKTLLSVKIFLSPEPSIVSKGQWLNSRTFKKSEDALILQQLENAHSDFLNITQMTIYNLSLIDKCYRENLKTPTCQMWKERVPLQWKESTDESGQKRKVWELISKTPLSLPPGLLSFGSKESLVIKAPEIRFNLMTRIFIPSGKIELQSNKISFPWLDVSGLSGSIGPSINPILGQKPWIKNAKICANRDYLEGMNFQQVPKKEKPEWVGFSIKNPFPRSVSVCATSNPSDTTLYDFTRVLDLGLAPESLETIKGKSGESGGEIHIDTSQSSEKIPMISPLFLSLGGDGGSGLDGIPSPLCNQGIYKSFKIGLSVNKTGFQKWINAQSIEPNLRLVSIDQFGDHWYGLFEINLPQTSGSDGGAAGPGGLLHIKMGGSQMDSKPLRWFLAPGIPGLRGKSQNCGPNEAHDGNDGFEATPGVIQVNKIITQETPKEIKTSEKDKI